MKFTRHIGRAQRPVQYVNMSTEPFSTSAKRWSLCLGLVAPFFPAMHRCILKRGVGCPMDVRLARIGAERGLPHIHEGHVFSCKNKYGNYASSRKRCWKKTGR